MKHALIPLFVLALASGNAYAGSNQEAAQAIAGKWSNTISHENFSINKRGIVGRNRSVCGELFQQEFSMESGSQWLARLTELVNDKSIPKSQYHSIVKEVDGNKSYALLQSSCEETGDLFILANPSTMFSISCGEGNCLVTRYVRAH